MKSTSIFNYFSVFVSLIVLPFSMMAQNERYGGAQNDVPTCMTLTPSGEIILAGYSKSFDDGSDQVFVLKLNPDNSINWQKSFGGKYGNRPFDMVLGERDEIIITGEAWTDDPTDWGREELFTLKLDSAGNLINEKKYFQYHRDMGFRIKRLINGSYISIGFTKSSEEVYGEMMVTKLDPLLNILWQTIIGENKSIDYGFEIFLNMDGFLAIGSQGGFFNSNQVDFLTPQSDILIAQLDFFGNLLWKKIYGGAGHDWVEKAVVINNEIYLVGSTQSIGEGSFDMLLLKMNMQGDSLWARSYGNEYYQQGRDISYGNGQLFFGGITKKESSNYAAANYIISTDLDGNILWERVIESTGSDSFKRMEFNNQNNSLHCLSSSHSEATASDFWLYSLNKDGQFTGIRSLSRNSNTQVFPNPVEGNARIEIQENNNSPALFQVYSISGQLVFEEELNSVNGSYSFSAYSLNSGFYTFKMILEDGNQFSGKFIVR